jgi:hypothetical protein
MSFLVIAGLIFLAAVGLATYVAVGELRYGHGRRDDD